MPSESIRLLIEAAGLASLQSALQSNPELANQSIDWYLNQQNHSDPLHYVCDCVFNGWLDEPKATEVTKLLIQHGANVDGTDGRESPLIAATSLGVEPVAKLLIESGADIEATALFGARPLHWAASLGLPVTTEYLISRGAQIEAKCTEFGATPLFWAVVGFGPHGPNKKRKPLESAKVLISAGANIDTTNKFGTSAISCSRDADSLQMFELLSKHVKK